MITTTTIAVFSRRNKYPIPHTDAYCLVSSSCFFLIPAYYAFYRGLIYYSILSIVTCIISINYWRLAIPGLRRSLDLVIAKTSFAIYFFTGIYFLKDLTTFYIAIPGCAGMIICYMLSMIFWDKDSTTWVYFHVLFHFFVAFEQYIVLSFYS